jgi:hypothetical protein
LNVRHERFQAQAFTRSIAANEREGIVRLEPQRHELRVSGSPDDYQRVRVFSTLHGSLVGTMVWSFADRVRWIVPIQQP